MNEEVLNKLKEFVDKAIELRDIMPDEEDTPQEYSDILSYVCNIINEYNNIHDTE